jgi:hypothetical protein
MKLPNYFLADLPPEATLSRAMLLEACQTLKRNREQYLAGRSTDSLVQLLAEVAEAWLSPDFPLRQLALQEGPLETGFSEPTLAAGLDDFFRQVTLDNLHALLRQELGSAQRLDRFEDNALACGPEFIFHITAGNVPNPTLISMLLGILTRSAQFVKCATGASFLPRLFAHSIYEMDSKLASCLEIAEWAGGRSDLEELLFSEADCITATGADETLSAIRARVPAKTRFLGYGHRVSFGFVSHEMLTIYGAKKVVARAADDIVAWDQHGCLSPHVIYVEHGGNTSGDRFAQMLADELELRESSHPRGVLKVETSAVISSRRGFYDLRASHIETTRVWWSKDSTAWSVVYENDPQFQLSCLNRFIYVKGVTDMTQVLQNAENVRGKVSTVGLAAPESRAGELALQLARWGVTRVCPLGQMQKPPLTWRHDGRPALGDLLTWTGWEK